MLSYIHSVSIDNWITMRIHHHKLVQQGYKNGWDRWWHDYAGDKYVSLWYIIILYIYQQQRNMRFHFILGCWCGIDPTIKNLNDSVTNFILAAVVLFSEILIGPYVALFL